MTSEPLRVGLLLFPRLTQLDLTGPYEVFTRMPGSEVHLVWKTLDAVRADSGLGLLPTDTLATCPPLDIICVPGGPGMNALLADEEILAFLRRTAQRARFVTSVCTGSLVLGAAGLLNGRRATSHWMSRDLLRAFGAEPVADRTVVDGNLFTGGGVTAGIDFALRIVAEICGQDIAKEIQLAIEYDPQPPFEAGSPRTADPALVDRVVQRSSARQEERAALVESAAKRLAAG